MKRVKAMLLVCLLLFVSVGTPIGIKLRADEVARSMKISDALYERIVKELIV